jgi:hypothetical protein
VSLFSRFAKVGDSVTFEVPSLDLAEGLSASASFSEVRSLLDSIGLDSASYRLSFGLLARIREVGGVALDPKLGFRVEGGTVLGSEIGTFGTAVLVYVPSGEAEASGTDLVGAGEAELPRASARFARRFRAPRKAVEALARRILY